MKTKIYFLALNRNTNQFYIGYSASNPGYAFRYEHKSLANAGNYKDYTYYKFTNIDDLYHILDKNLNILNGHTKWFLLNNQVKIRDQIQQYLQDRCTTNLIKYTKTDFGYIYEIENF